MSESANQQLHECLEHLDKNSKRKNQLMRYAEYRAMRVRIHVRHAGADDLYQEALLRTIDARRTCDASSEDVLWTHLRQTISSIANEWVRANYQRSLDLPKFLTPVQIENPAPEVEEQIDARRLAAALMRWFKTNDPEVVSVLTLLQEGYKPQEIQRELGLSVTDYDRIRKRISRHGKDPARQKGLYPLC